MRTLDEILNQLKQLDEITLLELLGLTSEDLVERYKDIVEDKIDTFDEELNQWFEESSDDEKV
jgi:hypothetical protein